MSDAGSHAPLAALAIAVGLLTAHLTASVLQLPGLAALDVADRLGSVAGIAALTLLASQALRHRRRSLVPVALTGQLLLLGVPAMLHADSMGASYDARPLALGATAQLLLTTVVVLVGVRVHRAIRTAGVVPLAVPHLVSHRCPVAARRATAAPRIGRPPGRAPPCGAAA